PKNCEASKHDTREPAGSSHRVAADRLQNAVPEDQHVGEYRTPKSHDKAPEMQDFQDGKQGHRMGSRILAAGGFHPREGGSPAAQFHPLNQVACSNYRPKSFRTVKFILRLFATMLNSRKRR